MSMTLALGIMDEPETNAAETNAVSSLSALIIAVNIVFAQCTLFEVVAEVRKKMRKRLRTKELWKRARRKKHSFIAFLVSGRHSAVTVGLHDRSGLASMDSSRANAEVDTEDRDGVEMQDLPRPGPQVQSAAAEACLKTHREPTEQSSEASGNQLEQIFKNQMMNNNMIDTGHVGTLPPVPDASLLPSLLSPPQRSSKQSWQSAASKVRIAIGFQGKWMRPGVIQQEAADCFSQPT